FISQGSAMEYDLTKAIKKITIKDKPSIGFITGHGEPELNKMAQAVQELGVLNTVETIDLSKEQTIPERYQALVLVDPTDSIPVDQFTKLNNYLAKGGKIFVAVNAVNGDLSTASGSEVKHDVFPWLQSLGVTVDHTFLIDAACAKVTVQQQRSSYFSFATQINFPYLPLVNKFPDHPATKGLEAVIFQFASPIKYAGSGSGTFTPLVTTSDKAGTQQAPLYFDVNKQWTNADFPMSKLVIGGVVEGAQNNPESKLVVFSDGDFFVSEQGKVNGDNVNLVVNTLEWMVDKSGLAELRTKGIVYRPIKDLEEGKRTFTKYLNFLLPLILVGLVGLWRTQRSRNLRIRRMEEKYS
ncbi:MAG TPA: Gldg family protein, partial [Saprospiraceae bacterium]|nr:Gldg family protein [Saprospiraceae bacterium]